MLHGSESAHYQVRGSRMLWGRSNRSRRESLAHSWLLFFVDETRYPVWPPKTTARIASTQFRVNTRPARNRGLSTQFSLKKNGLDGSGSHVSSENSGHTASMTLKLGGEYFQSRGAYRLQRLVSCALSGEESLAVVGVVY